MSPSLRRLAIAGAITAATLWTLAAFGTWWLLQAALGTLEQGSAASVNQAIAAWTDRPWVQHWLDPHDAAALRDGVEWLLGLGGGPAAWLGMALVVLSVVVVATWVGGLVLGALGVWIVAAALGRLAGWWSAGAAWPWSRQPPARLSP